jgi:hypothetical protein
MKRRNMKNYIVEIFEDTYGEQLYITNPNGVQIYAHRVMKGEGLERAKAVIAQQ